MRVSKKMLDPEKPQLGMIDRWYHPHCFVENREELNFRPEYSASQLKGFGLLAPEDKEDLKKQLPGVKSEGWVEGCVGCKGSSARGWMEAQRQTAYHCCFPLGGLEKVRDADGTHGSWALCPFLTKVAEGCGVLLAV